MGIIMEHNILKKNRGFTLLELILTMIVLTAVFGITAQSLMSSSSSLSFISNRKAAVADVRYGLNKMTQELRMVESDDIRSVSSTSIEFADPNSNLVTYQIAADGSKLAIYRNTDILIPNIATFDIEYLNGDGQTLTGSDLLIAEVRRIKLDLTTEPIGDEESIHFSTTVVPRSFVGYTNYTQ